jgi:flagellar assembly factor FliW
VTACGTEIASDENSLQCYDIGRNQDGCGAPNDAEGRRKRPDAKHGTRDERTIHFESNFILSFALRTWYFPHIGFRMEIQTTRFGWMNVDEQQLINFPRGLLGFPGHKQFALVQTGEENYFFWLQSVDDPNLAFVLTDPSIFFKDFQVPVRDEISSELQLADPNFLQVFAICNKVGDWLTGNLLGPLVVNNQNRLAMQVVLTEKKWTTRQPLMRLQAEVPLAKSA